ncbi:MAG: valine--tRNA ligase [Candidatus Pacebacteria bacterium]|nr:valine--tRNA ligase [Candidatus Paceibacterota bacterium]
MDKAFLHQEYEQKLYALWDKHHTFQPNMKNKKPPFSILLPPPNANASLHAGHAMFVIEDILIRWKRMQGHPTVWIPGTDHAGYESQYVYEKHLAKQGKSRFDFDRETLYNDIYSFVQQNSGLIEEQLKLLGFSLDWSRKTFMLDDHVVSTVYDTFAKMVKDGLVYRDHYIVNFCPKCGTTFADLEVKHEERKDPLYYIKYGPFVVATVRPETKFRDAALAANPKDKRYKDWIGKTIEVQGVLGMVKMTVIADEEVDPEFGTGIMKVTPAHDAHDFALGRRYNLPVTPIIDTHGKMDFSWFLQSEKTKSTEPKHLERVQKYHNKSVRDVRALMVEDMKADGLIEKVDENYTHNVTVCYKSGHDIEPLVLPNWFVRMKPLAKPAIEAVKKKRIQFVPKRFEKQYYQWMEHILDWPISRQIVWGIRIPVWYSVQENPNIQVTFLDSEHIRVTGTVQEVLNQGYVLEEIQKGLQSLRAPVDATYVVSDKAPGPDYLPETDTFDTWFSSGQWPLTTLHYPESKDFKMFYPTAVLDTMWDILFFWVARMIMFGLYLTKDVPFKAVYLHSMVTDEKGQKMSKSKGNVINPIDIAHEFGADALRIALVAGCAPENPIALSKEKVKGYRNFGNKLWNIGRFIVMMKEQGAENSTDQVLTKDDQSLLTGVQLLTKQTQKYLDEYRFSDAALGLYDFVWNTLANTYLEHTKSREDKDCVFSTLLLAFTSCLKLIHPFMPFVTEAIWQEFVKEKLVDDPLLITAAWPRAEH